MAITNEMIIMSAKEELAKECKLEYTGRIFTFETPDGEEINVPEVEDIHTYAKWKELGYQVRKGEKAIARFKIWKYTKGKKKAETEEEAIQKGYCFLKTASFFKASQVDKIENKQVV